MKRGKQINNRLLYSLIVFGILIAVCVGVFAASYVASGAGHPYTEISTCGANQVLKMNSAGTAWTCASDVGVTSCTAGSANCYVVAEGREGVACALGEVLLAADEEANRGICCAISVSCS